MKREQKEEFISKLSSELKEADLSVIAHYSGLTVEQITELRNKTKASGGKLQVIKKRLAKLAVEGTDHKDLQGHMNGPTIVAYAKANGDFSILKAAVEFSKVNTNLKILGGAYEGKALDVNAVNTYASLPSMDELRAKIIGVIQAPASQIARVLKAYSEKAEA